MKYFTKHRESDDRRLALPILWSPREAGCLGSGNGRDLCIRLDFFAILSPATYRIYYNNVKKITLKIFLVYFVIKLSIVM